MEIKTIFHQAGQGKIFDTVTIFSLKPVLEDIKNAQMKSQKFNLELECINKPKLRTFIMIKDFNTILTYITKPLTFIQCKMAKLRLGCLPIRQETGRFCRPKIPEIKEFAKSLSMQTLTSYTKMK